MEIPVKTYDARSVGFTLMATAGFNTVIAFILTMAGYGAGFGVNLVFAQCMGLSICGAMMTAMHVVTKVNVPRPWLLLGAALVGGTTLGLLVGSLVTGKVFPPPAGMYPPSGTYRNAVGLVAISLLFGIAVSYFFMSREQIIRSHAGSVEVASSEGQGTTFTVRLPRYP